MKLEALPQVVGIGFGQLAAFATYHELIHTNPPFDHIPPQQTSYEMIKPPAAQQ